MAAGVTPDAGTAARPDPYVVPVRCPNPYDDGEPGGEWLVTDGLGGYASGTVTGPHARRYHALLVVPLAPPLGRHVLLSRIEEEVHAGGGTWRITSTDFDGAQVGPSAGVETRSFSLVGGRATWAVAVSDAGTLGRQVWMEDGLTATFARYSWDGGAPCVIVLRPMATSRDFHHQWRGNANWRFEIERVKHPGIDGLQVRAHRHAPTWQLLVAPPAGTDWAWDDAQAGWWWNFLQREERARGFDCLEDLYCLGAISVPLGPGESLTVAAATAADGARVAGRLLVGTRLPDSPLPPPAFSAARAGGASLLLSLPARARAEARHPCPGGPDRADPGDPVPDALARAANAFLVRRATPGAPSRPGWTVLAGYHWFGDWGRDTFIALPGLARLTGRIDDARDVLRAWARVADRGMLPNRFPDSGAPLGEGDFNSVDATLWFLRAIDEVDAIDGGTSLAPELWPAAASMLDHHLEGTRHGIAMDPTDGLLRTTNGQLTWMDARVDGVDQVPRAGKPVEVNALWIHALDRAAAWAATAGDHARSRRYREAHGMARASFARRFWWEGEGTAARGLPGTAGYLLDCIDGPGGADASLRPNQVIAAAMASTPLGAAQRRAVVDVAREHLLTPRGLRTLSPADARYRGRCVGRATERDAAYHQGTAWAWLLGPFVDAWLLAGGDVATARSFLEPMRDHVWREACAGSISEIFDGDAPFHPRGAVAQAWSVAEVGRAWLRTGAGILPPSPA